MKVCQDNVAAIGAEGIEGSILTEASSTQGNRPTCNILGDPVRTDCISSSDINYKLNFLYLSLQLLAPCTSTPTHISGLTTEGRANNSGYPANLSGPYLWVNSPRLAYVVRNDDLLNFWPNGHAKIVSYPLALIRIILSLVFPPRY